MTPTEERPSHPANVAMSGEIKLGGCRDQDIVVRDGVVLRTHGVVAGRLTVLDGGRVHVHGQVQGDLFLAGRLTVRGRISGAVMTTSTAAVRIPDARGAIEGGIRPIEESAIS